MPAPEKTTMRQVKFKREMIVSLRITALQESKTLQEIYREALTWFDGYRSETPDLYYLSSPVDGKATSMLLPESTVRRAEDIAKEDSTKPSRVLYTGVTLYYGLVLKL